MKFYVWFALAFLSCIAVAQAAQESFQGRDFPVHVPNTLPAKNGALVIVLHGGMGQGTQIERTLGLDSVADKDGFMVAYLNGTPAGEHLPDTMKTWNAGGGCCGLSARSGVDDVAYITGAVQYLSGKYNIDPARIFVMGHSNGAMMSQRLMCETNLFAAAVPVSGILNTDDAACPAALGKRILAIHGSDDKNVPIAGGYGEGISRVKFQSEAHSKKTFEQSGATYTLDIVQGADHNLKHINEAIIRTESVSLPEKAAAFFGLGKN